MIDITVDDIISFHALIISRFKGASEIRTRDFIESSINNALLTFEGNDLYKTDIDKACRISYSLLMNHCFIDGNKRISTLVLIYLLKTCNYSFFFDHQKLIDFIYKVASSKVSYIEFNTWVKDRIK